MVGLGGYTYTQIGVLQHMQDEGAKRTSDGIYAQEADGIGNACYRVIADTIINRDFKDAADRWQAMRKELLQDMESVEKMADTDAEKKMGFGKPSHAHAHPHRL